MQWIFKRHYIAEIDLNNKEKKSHNNIAVLHFRTRRKVNQLSPIAKWTPQELSTYLLDSLVLQKLPSSRAETFVVNMICVVNFSSRIEPLPKPPPVHLPLGHSMFGMECKGVMSIGVYLILIIELTWCGADPQNHFSFLCSYIIGRSCRQNIRLVS